MFAFNTAASMEYMAGQIAEDWEADYDAGTLTVTIRDDVYFQEKEEEYDIYGARRLVAEDIKWSYDRILGLGSGWDTPFEAGGDWVSKLWMIESIDAVDDVTVVFNLVENGRNEVAINELITAPVNIAGPEWDELTEEQRTDWRYACGTGPYILEEFVIDSYMTLVRNDNYYCYDERYPENKLPYLDQVNIVVVTDSSNRLAQFIAGELDWVQGPSAFNDSELAQLIAALGEDGFVTNTTYTAPIGISLKGTHEAFQDIRVRQALNTAINNQEIHDSYYQYEGDMQMMGLFLYETEYSAADEWDDEMNHIYYDYDPEGAMELLAEAGYADGLEFNCYIFGNLDEQLFTLASTYLAQVGVTMNIVVAASPQEMQQAGFDPTTTDGMFWSAGKDSVAMAYQSFVSQDALLYNDQHFIDLLEAAASAESLSEQNALAQEADLYFAEQYWLLLVGGAEENSDFLSNRLQGITTEKPSSQSLRTLMARIWVDD